MKLSFLDRTIDGDRNFGGYHKDDPRTDLHRPSTCMIERHGATLRVAESAPSVRAWEPVVIRGGEGTTDAGSVLTGGVGVKAEITAKRFAGNRVSQDRYEATLQAVDGSPSALIAALSAACAGIDELRAVNGADERVILQISLIR